MRKTITTAAGALLAGTLLAILPAAPATAACICGPGQRPPTTLPHGHHATPLHFAHRVTLPTLPAGVHGKPSPWLHS
jgi:hypothetical protein